VRPIPQPIRHSLIISHLKRDGVVTVPNFIDSKVVKNLRGQFETMHGNCIGEDGMAKLEKFSEATGVRLQFETETMLSNPEIREIVSNPYFQEISAGYFGSVPIFCGVNAWWSLPKTNASTVELDRAAQLFHFDHDYPAFLKFFIYLTDVDKNSGPFTYVKQTHRNKVVWEDGRVTDERINATYGDAVSENMGKAGDLIIADTLGFHKGQRVLSNPRLILQVEFAVSRLGASCQYPLLPSKYRPIGMWSHTFAIFCK
jgi:hypothetical protein